MTATIPDTSEAGPQSSLRALSISAKLDGFTICALKVDGEHHADGGIIFLNHDDMAIPRYAQ
jgi:hypothetical protein